MRDGAISSIENINLGNTETPSLTDINKNDIEQSSPRGSLKNESKLMVWQSVVN